MKSTLALAAMFTASAHAAATSGKFTALSFNVAGLPELLQGNEVNGSKTENSGLIGTYFAKYGYDLIHLQEDFNYHAYIYATDNHQYRTPTSGGAAIGSGLNSLSNYSWLNFLRTKWNKCSSASGSDCLTPKGFTFMRWNPSEGVYIDVYNFHADAGTEPDDEQARNSNLQQVADYIDTWSVGNAVLVMGDTNSRYTRQDDTGIRVFKSQNNLQDAWIVNAKGGVYPTAGADALLCVNPSTTETCETVDKVLYRGSSLVSLSSTSFLYAGEQFPNTNPEYLGQIISDHNPVLVDFSWTTSSDFRQSPFSGGPHGNWFNDLPKLPASPVASVLKFSGADRLDSVSIQLADGTTFSHGGTGGTAKSLTLGKGERWISTKLCTGQKDGRTRNFYIKATTSDGRTLEVGTATDSCTSFVADSGYGVVGFMGQDGDEIDQLALIYARYA